MTFVIMCMPIQLNNTSNVFQITNDAVSYYEPGRRIPHCAYILQLLPGKSPQLLLHKVHLIGVSSPTFFHICFPQRKGECIYVLRL